MRLRRLEFVVIGLTLAFACFMGGFFTGRNWSAVNVVAVAAQNEESYGASVSIRTQETATQVEPVHPETVPPLESNQTQQTDTDPPQSSENVGEPRGGDGKININIATQTELTDLPGIGSVLASRIVDHRRQHGDFQRIEEIKNVSGIGEKRFEAIQEKITVGT